MLNSSESLKGAFHPLDGDNSGYVKANVIVKRPLARDQMGDSATRSEACVRRPLPSHPTIGMAIYIGSRE